MMNYLFPLFTVYIVWGSTYFAIAQALQGGFPPFLLGACRFLLAGIFLYVFLRWRGAPKPTFKHWKHCAFIGFFNLALGNGLVNFAEQSVSSGLASVVVASSAFWLVLFAALRGEFINRLEIIGLLLGFAGVLILNFGEQLSASPTVFIALLAAPIAWAYGSIWGRGRALPPPFLSAAMQMLCASAVMFIIAVFRGESFSAVPSLRALTSFFYLMLFGSILAYTAYIWLIQNVRAVIVSSYAYVNPLIALLLGFIGADERFGWIELAAILTILMGVIVLNFSQVKRIERKS